MALVLKVNSTDKTGYLMEDSLSINWQLNSHGVATFTLVEEAVNASDIAQSGQDIVIENDGTRIFGGTVKRIDKTTPNEISNKVKAWYYTVEAICYGEHLRNHLVAAVYENELAGDIIKDLVSTYVSGEGYTTTNTEDGPTISKVVYNYQDMLKAIEELAELTGYGFYVDCNKDIHFFSREQKTAPFSITDSQSYLRGLSVSRSHENYRNKQTLRAGRDITDTIDEYFKGDSERTTFTTAYPIALEPTIKVDTVTKTVGIRGIDTGKDWYWSKDSTEISQDSGGTVLTTSNQLHVAYKGYFPLIVIAEDTAEIAARAAIEGNDGVYEDIHDDQNIDVLEYAIEKAEGLLRRHGQIIETLNIETDESGLSPGQLLTVNLTSYGLDDDYLIDSVTGSDIRGVGFRYTVTALSGEGFGGWVEFFKKLAGSGRKFVIRDNEVVTLLRRFTEQVSLTDSLATSSNSIECEIGTAEIGYSEICS